MKVYKVIILIIILLMFNSCSFFVRRVNLNDLYYEKIKLASKELETEIRTKYKDYLILTLSNVIGIKKKYILYYDPLQNVSHYYRFELLSIYSSRYRNSSEVQSDIKYFVEDFKKLELPDFSRCNTNCYMPQSFKLTLCYNGTIINFYTSLCPNSECVKKRNEITQFSEIVAMEFFEHIDDIINRGEIESY